MDSTHTRDDSRENKRPVKYFLKPQDVSELALQHMVTLKKLKVFILKRFTSMKLLTENKVCSLCYQSIFLTYEKMELTIQLAAIDKSLRKDTIYDMQVYNSKTSITQAKGGDE